MFHVTISDAMKVEPSGRHLDVSVDGIALLSTVVCYPRAITAHFQELCRRFDALETRVDCLRAETENGEDDLTGRKMSILCTTITPWNRK